MDKAVQLTKYQLELLQSTRKHVLLLGSIGSGKSFILAHCLLNQIVKSPGINVLVVANTYSQLVNATTKAITTVLDDLGIPYKATLGGSKKQIQIGKSTVYLYSLDSFNNIRGIEVGLLLGDEIAYTKREAIDVCLGRLRQKGMPLLARYFTSPNGYNWLYDMFVSTASPNTELITATIFDNPFLPEDYIQDLINQYGGIDSPLAQQELMGKFVNLNAGAIYTSFSRDKIIKSDLTIDSRYPVYVGVDFNIGNMSAVYVQFINEKFTVVKEVSQTFAGANTYTLCDEILKDLSKYNILIVPDSTGKARKTSSSKSDHQIIRDACLTIIDTQNPLIRDRQNSVNAQFYKESISISDTCVKLSKEIETLSARDDEGSVVHLCVALGYIVWKLAPLRKPSQKSQTINI